MRHLERYELEGNELTYLCRTISRKHKLTRVGFESGDVVVKRFHAVLSLTARVKPQLEHSLRPGLLHPNLRLHRGLTINRGLTGD